MGSAVSSAAEMELMVMGERNGDHMLFSTASNGTTADKYSDVAKYKIVDIKGDDLLGRKVVVVYAFRFPPVEQLDHGRFLEYLISTLDRYVEQDYSLIYYHYGLTSKNRPPTWAWLLQMYRAFDRKYKKNLKALYLVHPTGFLKFVFKLLQAVISIKFGKKMNYIDNLKQLANYVPLEQLAIPPEIIEYDKRLGGAVTTVNNIICRPVLPTEQFGSSLKAIKEHYKVIIPPVVTQCVDYLNTPNALRTEGLFRRSANVTKIIQLKELANRGSKLTFEDPHTAAVLLKTFLKELEEPLLTFQLYDKILQLQFKSWNKFKLQRQMEKLPEENYQVLKYIINFLSRVMEYRDLNKMTASNLAVVFGPNLVWSESESMSLSAIGPINMFTQFILVYHNDIFVK